MKVYTVLYCGWEGDGYFIITFRKNFRFIERALKYVNDNMTKEEYVISGAELPNDSMNGDYGSPGFYYIYENVI
ncbi:hypothetical protein KKH23_05940 [Patescibacteria group bacterium]|nr:hypothetical protein [Patescibacteria group bacterium]